MQSTPRSQGRSPGEIRSKSSAFLRGKCSRNVPRTVRKSSQFSFRTNVLIRSSRCRRVSSNRGEDSPLLPKLLRSNSVHAMLIVYAMIFAGLLFVVQAHVAAAAPLRDTLIVGLQNDMVNPNYFDTATNSVWKQYHVEFNFEGLFSHDPDFTTFNVLSDPSKGGSSCPAGTPTAGPGYCFDTTGTQVTVFLRSNATFTNGQALTADDVVFTYQTLPWSTYQLSVKNAIWWGDVAPKFPLWNATTCGSSPKCQSHVGVEKIDATTVKFTLAKNYALFFYDTMEV